MPDLRHELGSAIFNDDGRPVADPSPGDCFDIDTVSRCENAKCVKGDHLARWSGQAPTVLR